jgi:hypothetical protein
MNAKLLRAHFQHGDFVNEVFHRSGYLLSVTPAAAVVVRGRSNAVR